MKYTVESLKLIIPIIYNNWVPRTLTTEEKFDIIEKIDDETGYELTTGALQSLISRINYAINGVAPVSEANKVLVYHRIRKAWSELVPHYEMPELEFSKTNGTTGHVKHGQLSGKSKNPHGSYVPGIKVEPETKKVSTKFEIPVPTSHQRCNGSVTDHVVDDCQLLPEVLEDVEPSTVNEMFNEEMKKYTKWFIGAILSALLILCL